MQPQPITPEIKAKAEKLYKENEKLVYGGIRYCANAGYFPKELRCKSSKDIEIYGKEDYIQGARIVLWQSCVKHLQNPGKCSLSHRFYVRLRVYFRNLYSSRNIPKWNYGEQPLELDTPLFSDDPNTTMLDTIADSKETEDRIVMRIFCNDLWRNAKLPDPQRKTLKYYLRGYEHNDIVRLVKLPSVSRSKAHVIMGLQKIRCMASEMPEGFKCSTDCFYRKYKYACPFGKGKEKYT
jgi:hypothetical protein